MARPPRPAPNPGYLAPAAYLAAGLVGADGAVRPELLTDRAARTGRELLIRGVPLEKLQEAYQAVEALARTPAEPGTLGAALRAIGRGPSLRAHPLITELLDAGGMAVRSGPELAAFSLHLRRVLMLATFDRVLAAGSAAELARAERARPVARARKRRLGGQNPR